MVPPRIRSRHDRYEAVVALRIGQGATATSKVRIERRRVLVRLVEVPPRRVALPDLDQGIPHRNSIVIEHATRHGDTLADRLTSMLTSEVAVGLADLIVAEQGPGYLRQRVRKHDERLAGCPENGRTIWRIERRRLGIQVVPAVGQDEIRALRVF